MGGFDNGNEFGLIAAAGMALQQNRYDGYVQAFLAQGMTLAQAQASANDALGIRPLRPRHYYSRAVGWGAVAAFFVWMAVTMGTGPGAGGAIAISAVVAVLCAAMGGRNVLKSLALTRT